MHPDSDLPDEVHLTRFAAARSRELTALTQCLVNPARTKLAFQALPVHMRRRVMSHNSKRLPRRLRLLIPDSDSPSSRKARRRPRRLLKDYASRQRLHAWLETHIWHAKRFHMVKIWGRNLPESPCDRAFRACYRAGSAHCLLRDVSYMGRILLSGTLTDLMIGLRKITSADCGLTFGAKCYVGGRREGDAFVFRANRYPHDCLGRVSFLWNVDYESNASLMIFAHPSFCSELVEVLVGCFGLSKEPNDGSESAYYSVRNYVRLVESNGWNRFRLTGPLSHAVLKDVLMPVDVSGVNDSKDWFRTLLARDNVQKSHVTQAKFWEKIRNLSSPAELQSKIIVGLNVEDPRVNFPSKRTKSLPSVGDRPSASDLIDIPDHLSSSLLWKKKVQDTILEKKLSNFEINNIRQNASLVPGEPNDLLKNVSGIPVILIQQPGSKDSSYKKLGYNSGWDIIVPAGYAMPFWLSFVLRGARTGGLKESNKMSFESGICDFQPDTQAGKTESVRIENILKNRYFRLPPNKRVNFAKLSINSPFSCRWETLLKDWTENEDAQSDYFVLRERKLLEELQLMLLRKGNVRNDFPWNENCLVPVKISLKSKGKLSDFALICLPSDNDTPGTPTSCLVEPLKSDKNSKIRKELRNKHKKMLKSLRRKSIIRKKKIVEKAKEFVYVPKQNNTKIIEEYLSKMRELWLPSNINNVKNQCSRTTIGYVVKGDFSFTEAKSTGIGYVALKSLLFLLQNKSKNTNLILVRNTLSRQYRFAYVEIISNMLL